MCRWICGFIFLFFLRRLYFWFMICLNVFILKSCNQIIYSNHFLHFFVRHLCLSAIISANHFLLPLHFDSLEKIDSLDFFYYLDLYLLLFWYKLGYLSKIHFDYELSKKYNQTFESKLCFPLTLILLHYNYDYAYVYDCLCQPITALRS